MLFSVNTKKTCEDENHPGKPIFFCYKIKAQALHIINFAENAYHQNEVLYIIKSQRNTPSVMIYTLKRDDIRLAAMIYQVCDLDKKILQKMYPFLQYFLVEPRGIEPLSEASFTKPSPGAVNV